MQQVLSAWLALDPMRRVIVLVSTVAMFAAILVLARTANTPGLALMYSGLEPPSAGQIVQALDQRGVRYEVRGTGIFVDSSQRDKLRMELASEGLPLLTGQGYELLDGLSGFGTTSQMFDAAYWRAKEGELARTIQAGSTISSARVHLANSLSQPFRESRSASASVTAIAVSGALSASNARAIQYLVASAVAGLTPENVSVIDGRTGAVVATDGPGALDSGQLDRALVLKKNVERLLEARVGPGNALVELSFEVVTEREAITERFFDPEGRVAISTETEETTQSENDSGSGGVTVASNLPEGDTSAGGRQSSSQNASTREIQNFEVSETRREVVRTPGAIKRLTVAVLVNGTEGTDPDTGDLVFLPRSDAEIAALRELVASAVGLDEARGDLLTIKSMEFSPVAPLEVAGAPSLLQTLNLDVMRIIQVSILALVAIVIGLFVVRPLLMRPDPGYVDGQAVNPALQAPSDIQESPSIQLPGAGNSSTTPTLLPGQATAGSSPNAVARIPDATGDDRPPAERLKNLIESRGPETVALLDHWIQEEKEGA